MLVRWVMVVQHEQPRKKRRHRRYPIDDMTVLFEFFGCAPIVYIQCFTPRIRNKRLVRLKR